MSNVNNSPLHVNGPSPCLAAALDYLARGWSPLPLREKRPLLDWKPHQTAPALEVAVQSWWRDWPTANVGLALGPVSGLVGLDVDGDAGKNLLTLWQGAHGPLPHTLQFATAKGCRLLFRWPVDGAVKNQEYRIDGGELRLLGKGRQTVMPPSIHPTGKEYAWEDGCRPGEVEPAELPAWLLGKFLEEGKPEDVMRKDCQGVRPEPRPVAPGLDGEELARRYVRSCDPAVSRQGGHNQTMKVACHVVRRAGPDVELVYRILAEEYNSSCDPPWSQWS